MINPCTDFCYARYGKQYSSDCDDKCEYAKVVKKKMLLEERKQFALRVVYCTAMVGCAVCVVRFTLPVLMPFILAFFIAALIQVPIKRIEKILHGRRKAVAIFLCALFYIVFFTLVLAIAYLLYKMIGSVLASVPAIYNEKVTPAIGELTKRLETAVSSIDPSMSQRVEEVFNEISQNVGQYVTDCSVSAIKLLSGYAVKIPGLLVKLIITIVATFFLAPDFDKVNECFRRAIPIEKKDEVENLLAYIKGTVFVYFKAYTFLFLLTFTELFVGFLILRIPYALVLAFAIAVFDIMPVLAMGGILLPWIAILLLTGNLALAAGMLVLYLIISVVRNTVEPRIVGKQIGLHPFVTLLSMFLGLKLLGFVGMFALPVILAILTNFKKGEGGIQV